MESTTSSRLLAALLLTATLSMAAMADERGLYDQKVVGREKEKCRFISNLSWDEIKQPMAREWLLKKDRCEYYALADLGTFGKRKDELLPHAWDRDEWVIVVNMATLTAREAELYEQLSELFPLMPGRSPDTPQVRTFIQKSGKREYQVVLELPEASWLDDAADLLWSIPLGSFDAQERGWMPLIHDVAQLAVLTNMDWVEDLMETVHFTRVRFFSPEQADEYADVEGATQRLIALNYNGPAEISAEMAEAILPEALIPEALEGEVDRLGLTPWQRFCRKAQARHFESRDGAVDTWFIGAPTDQLARRVFNQTGLKRSPSGVSGTETTIDVCDASWIRSMAVGVYMLQDTLARDRLVLEEQLEQTARAQLGRHIAEISSGADLGAVLAEVMGPDPSSLFRQGAEVEHYLADVSADALLVLWVRDLTASTHYDYEPTRETQPLPEFAEVEPRKPNPDAKPLFSGHTYPGDTTEERARSRKYQDDLQEYYRDHREWEYRRADHARQVADHQVTWRQTITACPAVNLTGYCKLVDLKGKRIVWSIPISTSARGRETLYSNELVTVRGDSGTPRAPAIPNASREWDDMLFPAGQDAIISALRKGVEELERVALWSTALKPWNLVQAGSEPEVVVVTEEQSTTQTASETTQTPPTNTVAQETDTQTQTPTPTPPPEIVRELVPLGDASLVYDGTHCLLPAAAVIRWAQGDVKWTPATSTLDITLPGDVWAFLKMGDAALRSNTGISQLPVTPRTVDGRAFVPTEVLEALGFQIAVDQDKLNLSFGDKHGYMPLPR